MFSQAKSILMQYSDIRGFFSNTSKTHMAFKKNLLHTSPALSRGCVLNQGSKSDMYFIALLFIKKSLKLYFIHTTTAYKPLTFFKGLYINILVLVVVFSMLLPLYCSSKLYDTLLAILIADMLKIVTLQYTGECIKLI